MATLIETLNATREDTISTHYGAASAELKDKIKAEPLRTTFHVYAGCVSKPVTAEIAARFNSQGLKATPEVRGWVLAEHFLTVEVTLPESLVHIEEPAKVDEVKPVEITTVEETKAEEVKPVEIAVVEEDKADIKQD